MVSRLRGVYGGGQSATKVSLRWSLRGGDDAVDGAVVREKRDDLHRDASMRTEPGVE